MRQLNRTEFLIIVLLIVVLPAIGLPWLLSSREVSRLHDRPRMFPSPFPAFTIR